MRIGIDAKWYFSGPPSGRLVVRNLVDTLLREDRENEIFLFLKGADRHQGLPVAGDRVKPVYISVSNNLLANLLVIPWYCLRYRISVTVFQNFCTCFPQGKKIAFIHDAIFKTHPQFFTLKERLYFAPMLFLARFADRICTVSHSEKKRISSHSSVSPSRIDVTPNGVDHRFTPLDGFPADLVARVRERYGLPRRFLLYVGRLNERKNLINLLRALPLMKCDLPLVIVGSQDWKMFAMEEEIGNLKIKDRVIMTGFVPDEELPVIYALASVFCFVSLEEGFGLPALEAMASEVPVVVSDIEVMREVCGDAGNYVDPHAPADIARVIDLIAADPQSVAEKIAAGKERAGGFTWERSVRRLRESIAAAVGA